LPRRGRDGRAGRVRAAAPAEHEPREAPGRTQGRRSRRNCRPFRAGARCVSRHRAGSRPRAAARLGRRAGRRVSKQLPRSASTRRVRAAVGRRPGGGQPGDSRGRARSGVRRRRPRTGGAAPLPPGTFRPFIDRCPPARSGIARDYDGLVDHGSPCLLSRYVATVPRVPVAVYFYPSAPNDLDRLRPLVAAHARGFTDRRRAVTASWPTVSSRSSQGGGHRRLRRGAVRVPRVPQRPNSCLAFVSTALGFIWSAGLLTLSASSSTCSRCSRPLPSSASPPTTTSTSSTGFSVEGTRPMREC